MPAMLDLRRTLAALVAVAMSAALIVFSFIISDTAATQMTAAARASVGDADVVILPEWGGELSEEAAGTVSAASGVAGVRSYTEGTIWIDRMGSGGGTEFTYVLDVPSPSGGTRLVEGRLPQKEGEIAVSPSVAEQDVAVGSAMALKEDPVAAPTTAAVVGVIAPGPEITRWSTAEQYIFATADERAALGLSTAPAALYASATSGTSTQDLMDSVSQALDAVGLDASVYSASDIVMMRASNMGDMNSTTQMLLQLLGPVCAVVAGIVIATTFSTLVARQARQTGLLRCIGAGRAQVFGSVLRSALATGLAGSVVGTILGVELAALLTRSGLVDGLEARYLTVNRQTIVLAVVLSTAVTLVAVVRPARQATRVSPLVALTGQVADERSLSRRRMRTAAAGVVVALIGLGITWLSMWAQVVVYTAVGAVLLVLGVLAGLPLLVVGGARLVEWLGGGARRPVLQLAARNLARNPGRAAATTASLLVTVTVGATLLSGIASVNASMSALLGASAPVDIRVDGIVAADEAAALAARAKSADGVEQAAVVPLLDVGITPSAYEADEITVSAVDPAAAAPVVRSDKGLEGLDDHTLVLANDYGLAEGTAVTLTGSHGSAELTVHVAEAGLGPVVTPAVAEELAGQEPTALSLWVRTTGDGTDTSVVDSVRDVLQRPDLVVSTSATERVSFNNEVNRIVTIIVAVLAFTLLITLSGLANTTDVSVLERFREIGVLRATGVQRGQVRRLFITEAVLTSLLGGLLGAAVGTVCGMAAVVAVFGLDAVDSLVLQVPWAGLVGILLAAAAIGVLAALRPAGRAAAVAPVSALAQE
ncbi:ABC transporter permease [Actinomyces glycerinitolerans]|uniref:Abc transporter permease protein domain n=1 Tax=Actinomyces glycerinitolerans TaxID=1892869 RepID=A0A1M4RVD4_9ACTO|nr:FtsX-like permease family protein [Actinomyces glycerinitolerans]SHE23945.1 abc transporter permease protein domain [Actinomyces glycerinitolerans]